MTNPDAKFRRDALNVMSNHAESVTLRLDRTEKATADNTEAIKQIGEKIDRLTSSIQAQSQNIGRLERAVTEMVAGINSQRATVDSLIKLATKLVDQRAG